MNTHWQKFEPDSDRDYDGRAWEEVGGEADVAGGKPHGRLEPPPMSGGNAFDQPPRQSQDRLARPPIMRAPRGSGGPFSGQAPGVALL